MRDTSGTDRLFPSRPAWLRRLGTWKQACTVKAMVPLSRWLGANTAEAIGIITYHRIAPIRPGESLPPLCVTPERFREQLQGLRDRGFRAVSLRHVLEQFSAGRPLVPKSFVIVFDDGYENIYHHAWPVLRDLGMPATVFLATSYVGSNERVPFDDWECAGHLDVPVESWRMLSVEQCRDMQQDGLLEFGSHTHRHEDFRGRPEAFQKDLELSLEFLANQLDVHQPCFALPYGFLDPPMLAELRRASLSCSLTCDSQLIRKDQDPFLWGRFGAEQYDTATTLAAKLDGTYSRVQGIWRRIRPGIFERNAHEVAYRKSFTT